MFQAKRVIFDSTHELSAPPEKVFPQLCPVLEYDWIEGWQCEMVYSESGVAEELCMFQTGFSGDRALWTCVRYEPPSRIEYLAVCFDLYVMRLRLELEGTATGTRLRWHRTFTGLSEAGNEKIAGQQAGIDQRLTEQLEHFLTTGKMLSAHA